MIKLCKPFLLLGFLLILPACEAISLEKSSTEIMSVDGDKYRCEYYRGVKVNCYKVMEEENEKITAFLWKA